MSSSWRTPAGWVFAPLHVGIVGAPGQLLHVERATAAVLARYREDQAIRRRVLGSPPCRLKTTRYGQAGVARRTRRFRQALRTDPLAALVQRAQQE